eukprot:CAMPEP_0175234774 /NCGR_PEP_ID=MMETSP0093-20121207/27156_1 /TAXON_ID=311494 /ORGANISM="Alexandrium monilatum, Strain CCMP3105" /LENGTH=114 /DNA_ID=CAMNT_0016528689 /DNA_START=187 /DNA_END=528 /DNA_ORIENTATION=-
MTPNRQDRDKHAQAGTRRRKEQGQWPAQTPPRKRPPSLAHQSWRAAAGGQGAPRRTPKAGGGSWAPEDELRRVHARCVACASVHANMEALRGEPPPASPGECTRNGRHHRSPAA